MHAILLTAAFAATPVQSTCESAPSAAQEIQEYAQTGTLIFSQGDCLAVRMFTRSPYTHVATVVMEEGKPYVYDSMNGVGVRKLPLEKYCDSECPNTMHVYRPTNRFSKRRCELFVEHLKSELGRPYGVKHHVTGNRAEGIHCAEYMMDAFAACRLMKAEQPSKVSPDSLRKGVEQAKLYDKVLVVKVVKPTQTETGDNWCEQMWIDTKVCTVQCWSKLGRWFLCK
ncbi:MAG: hypothetical protein KDA84_04325 [Planctomycetaceae bacterium]|nr:hypothetical protein [Planctomycetaceae bacterium]